MVPLQARWLPLLLLLVVQAAGFARNDWAVAHGGLFGPDAYMRVARVAELHDLGVWYAPPFSRANTPHGDALHWTKPLDLMLLAGAYALQPFLDFKTALHWWSVLLSPLLHLLTLLALYWAVRPLFDAQGQTLLGLMFLFQPGLIANFLAGRPDHHGLQSLGFVLLSGFMLRALAERPARRALIGAGLTAAFAIWVSVEALAPFALLLASFGLIWLYRGGDLAARGMAIALVALVGLALALAIERPPGEWLQPVYDSLSIVQLCLIALLTTAWAGLAVATPKAGGGTAMAARLAAAILATGIMAAAMWWLYPAFFAGPAAEVDARIMALWFSRIAEVTSPLAHDDPAKVLRLLFNYLGPVLVALPYLVYLMRHAAGEARILWLFLALPTFVFTAATLYQLRWNSYAELLYLIPYAALLNHVLLRLTPRRRLTAAVARLLVILMFGGGWLVAGAIARTALDERPRSYTCPLGPVAEYLADPADLAGPGARPRRILSHIFKGPELLYRTPHAVVATPYHRNRDGILDTIDFFTAIDDRQALSIATNRGLELILICPRDRENAMYRRDGDAPTLIQRLIAGDAPDWLRERRLPDGIPDFRLFEIVR